MKNGNVLKLRSKGIAKAMRRGSMTLPLVLMMLLGLLMPAVSAAPSPDLSLDPLDITVGPLPLVEGVQAQVNYNVWNLGDQNAFNFNMTLFDHGIPVANAVIPTLAIGSNHSGSLYWTPKVPGVYSITVRAWYGPVSAKQDTNWADNNASVSIDVKSRPDVYLAPADISFTAPDPEYVVDGDTVTVRAVLHNSGTAGVTGCNVTLWEGMVGGGGELIVTQSGVTLPGSGQTTVSLTWNTTGFSGRRMMFVRVTDVYPTETNLGNNVAYIAIKVHTKEDRVFTIDKSIPSDFKIQFFITVRGSATLTIRETGNATVYQDFDEQYDLEVMDRAKLVIDGGMLNASMNYTVRMTGTSELHLLNGAEANVRVVASGSCKVLIDKKSVLTAPSVEMSGGSLSITNGSSLNAARLVLSYTTLKVSSSMMVLSQTVDIVGRNASIKDTSVKVTREFETLEDAIGAYPSIEDHDPDTKEVVSLPVALRAVDGAVVDLINVSVDSMVRVREDETNYWTQNRLGAVGRSSVINVHRYLDVLVVDWFGEVVPGADVEVLDYFDEIVMTSGTTDEDGRVMLSVKTDYITPALKPFIGNIRLRASAFERTSDDIRMSHNKYPQMNFTSNVVEVTIEMPPNPYPDVGENFVRYIRPRTISGDESGLDKNIIVDNTELLLLNTSFTLEQEHPYQWYVLVTGEQGTLKLDNCTFGSAFPFKIYLEEGGTLNVSRGSEMTDAHIIAKDFSVLQIADSKFTGGIYAECKAIDLTGSSTLHVTHTHLEATNINIVGGSVHEDADLFIKANYLTLVRVELSAEYRIADSMGLDTLKDIKRYFGWTILNEIDLLTNISQGYFDYFAGGSNITIDTLWLTVQDAFVYAEDVNIMVRRTPQPNQATIMGSSIGGINLTLISDDLTATYTSFNRVLDSFSGTDSIVLKSVEVPGIVCSGNAVVNRYWHLTVFATDGAGSIRPKALLEVFSTETQEKLFPPVGDEDLDTSRTNSAGRLTVALLANRTDATGDYFVGSIYLWLMYDGYQGSQEPVYTPMRQLNLKSDIEIHMRFPMVIAPLEKDIEYVLYDVQESGPSIDLKVFKHTFGSEEEAERFLNETIHLEPDRSRFNWTIIRNSTIQMTFSTSARINNIWEPLKDGIVRVYILQTPDPNPNAPATDWEGNPLKWEVRPDVNGIANVTIQMPEALGTYQLYIAISGGDYDPNFEPITLKFQVIEVEPPQTIQITSGRIMEYPVRAGDAITVQGTVRYIYAEKAVQLAEVTVSGTYVTPVRGLTDTEGRFSIVLQAPLTPQDNITLTIVAQDPSSDEESALMIAYSVEPLEEPTVESEFPWGWVMVGIIAIVIALSIAIGAVMMYRRHYGEVVECGECGAFIPATSTTCPKCGIEFETDLARCSECEAWIPANSSSCPVCGTAFTIESLEEQVAKEEADEDLAPIDQVTTSTAQLTPLTLEGASQATKWGDKEEKRRRRIKKRVKKRLTVTDTGDMAEGGAEEAQDLFIGEGGPEATRLPGLGVDESMLSDDELSRLLPTEEMLKELMLTSERSTGREDEEAIEGEEGAEDTEVPEGPDLMAPQEELEEVQVEEADEEGVSPELEEIPPPDTEDEDLALEDEDEAPLTGVDEGPAEDEGMPERSELLSELGIMADVPTELDLDMEEPSEEEDESLKDILQEGEAKEAPKLCPNCGGNWILYKDGEYTCRICGEKW